MPSLTKTFIEKKIPKIEPGKQAIYWDDDQQGLGLRCTAGSKTFVFQGRLNGASVRIKIGAWPTWTIAKAQEQARELSVMVDKGVDPRLTKKKTMAEQTTLGAIFDKYMKEKTLKLRTRYDYQRYMNIHLKDWLGKPVTKIDSGMVTKRYQDISASNSGAAQASSVMRVLRSVLNFAQADIGEAVLPANPVNILTTKKTWIKDNAKTGHLHTYEIKPFIEAVRALDNPVMAGYIEFILLTGARRSEAAKLKWKDVNHKSGVLIFTDTKNKENRAMPITPRLAELLDDMKPLKLRGCDYIFATVGKDGKPTHVQEPRKAIAAANRSAESAVTVHDLRRTYATILESLDCPAYPLKALLGHSLKSDVTTAHYTQISVERLRPWAVKYEQHLLKLVGDAPSADVVMLAAQA